MSRVVPYRYVTVDTLHGHALLTYAFPTSSQPQTPSTLNQIPYAGVEGDLRFSSSCFFFCGRGRGQEVRWRVPNGAGSRWTSGQSTSGAGKRRNYSQASWWGHIRSPQNGVRRPVDCERLQAIRKVLGRSQSSRLTQSPAVATVNVGHRGIEVTWLEPS